MFLNFTFWKYNNLSLLYINNKILYEYFPVSHIILSFIPNQTLNHRTQFTTSQRDVKEAFR